MVYSQFYIKNKQRIPTLVVVFTILMTVVLFARFFAGTQSYTRASKKVVRRVEIVNISPVQVTVFWQTDLKEEGWIVYGESKDSLKNIALDERDVRDKKSAYMNHYVTIRSLKEKTNYYFKLVTGNQVVVRPDGSLFDFRTPDASFVKQNLSPANGKIAKSNLQPLANAVVVLQVDGFYPISVLSKETGEWLIPLNSFYSQTDLTQKTMTGKERARLEVVSEEGMVSTVNGSLGKFSPVLQTIIIGHNYNLQEDSNVLSVSTSFISDKAEKVVIIYPQEGAVIPGSIPNIKGKAPPRTKIDITINSAKTFSAIVTADSEGFWSYVPPQKLEIGNHTITVRVNKGKGNEVLMTRNFRIIARENIEGSVLGDATESATSTSYPTATPTVYIYPTSIPVLPTAITPSLLPSPTNLLNSGFLDIKPLIGGFSLIILGAGFFLFF